MNDLTYILESAKYQEGKEDFLRVSPFSDAMNNWLEEIGFFFMPASTKFHGCYPGGLVEHSMMVAMKLQEITNAMNLKWERKESPVVVGLLHDLCKVDSYIIKPKKYPYDPNEKEVILWNKNQEYEGHGGKSVQMILRYAMESGEFYLTKEEEDCIRFHMGAFDYKEEEKAWEKYGGAVSRNENVLWTHTADMWADEVACV